jgi:hypothetical protein
MKGHSRSIGVWKRDGKKKTRRTSIVLLTLEGISGLKIAEQCTQVDLSGLRPFQVGDFRCYVRACKSRDQFSTTSVLPWLFCFLAIIA